MSEGILWLVLAAGVILMAGATLVQAYKQGEDMGIVKDTLARIEDNLVEAGTELVELIRALRESLESKVDLDVDDLDTLDRIELKSAALASIVDDGVTEPLPDPSHSENLDPADPEVIDPEVSIVTDPDAVDPVEDLTKGD